MALRQNIESVPLGDGLFARDVVQLKRMRDPKVGRFRSGADLGELLELIAVNTSVAVNAAVGAGKSTRLPGEIAAKLGLLVVQVVPNSYLASDLADYVKSIGVQCVAHLNPQETWPVSGVVIVSASSLIAHWLALGRLDMPPCVLFHDESHESDAYTYLVRTIWTAIPGIRKYVSATATGDAGDFRRQEGGGAVELKHFSAEHVSEEWDLDGNVGHPWEIESIRDNLLIFEDNKDVANKMVSAYNIAGFVAFRMHARMKMDQFRAAMHAGRSGESIVIMIADSTFRSGFTMPVSTVIDSAVIGFSSIQSGVTIRDYRDAYSFERYQAAGRVGRIKGSKAVVWSVDTKPDNKMVILEDLDADAAVLLYRAFCVSPPRALLDSQLCEGKVPRELISALQDYTALALLHNNMLTDPELMGSEDGRRSPMVRPGVRLANADSLDYENPIVSADVARTCYKSDVGKWEKRVSSDSGYSSSTDVSARSLATTSVSEAMSTIVDAVSVEDVEICEGGYYCVPSMPPNVRDFSPVFPDGYITVVKFLSADYSRGIHYGLSTSDRWVAINSLIHRLNMVSCELNSVMTVAQDVGSLAGGRDPVAVREWVSSFMARVGQLQADSRVLIDCLVRVTHRFCEVQQVPPELMSEQEASFAGYVVKNLRSLPTRKAAVSDVHTFVRKKMLEEMPEHMPRPSSLMISDAHSDVGNSALLGTVRMPRVGRGMRVAVRRGSMESNPMRLGRYLKV